MKNTVFDPRASQKIKKFLTGGLATGTAAGTGIALLNYLNDLYKDTQEGNSTDDDVLYVDLPQEEALPKEATISGGTALTAGILATAGSAAAVQNIYQEIKKRQLQKELDKAQVAYTGKVLEEAEAEKEASVGSSMSKGDLATSIPVSLLLLTTLASGALTYKGLNKHFPATKKPQSITPKRVVIRDKKPQPAVYDEEPNEEEIQKNASYEDQFSEQERLDDGLEYVIKLAMHNTAPHSDLRNIVYKVASGGYNEFCNNAMEMGMNTALSLTKNASTQETSEERINLAISKCVKSAYLRPTVEILAYSEFHDLAPTFVKAASNMSEDSIDALAKIACVLGASFRHEFWKDKCDDQFIEKEAGFLGDMLMESLLEEGSEENTSAEEVPLTSETESEVSQSQRPEDQAQEVLQQDRRLEEEQTDDSDEIDSLMSGMAGGTSANGA